MVGCGGVWAPRGGTWRVKGPGDHHGHVLLVSDLQDMSLMTLSTKTPKNFFDKYQLVLQVPKARMSKVRVFQATRESAWPSLASLPLCHHVPPCPHRTGHCPVPLPFGKEFPRTMVCWFWFWPVRWAGEVRPGLSPLPSRGDSSLSLLGTRK